METKKKGEFIGMTVTQEQEAFLKKVAKRNGLKKYQEVIRRMIDEKRLTKELLVW